MEAIISSLQQIDERAWNDRLKASPEATSRQTSFDARRIQDYFKAEPFFLEIRDQNVVKARWCFINALCIGPRYWLGHY